MDEIHFAPPKIPWGDASPVSNGLLWFQSGAKWISSTHSIAGVSRNQVTSKLVADLAVTPNLPKGLALSAQRPGVVRSYPPKRAVWISLPLLLTESQLLTSRQIVPFVLLLASV